MRYRDLVQFEPLETVIQLREAEARAEAERLVRTYVISARMAERLTDVIFPQLRFDQPADNKALLVVGNYGTGKSHLMSVLSAIAEHADLVSSLTDDRVAAAAAESVAGRLQVLRTEIGTTTMRLRDILFLELEAFLAQRGIQFTFPSLNQVSNSKDPLLAMMEAFNARFPDQGLLVVMDEMLDYLRGRREQELVLDLNFMRELGEVCRLSRLRFIGGVQEALFDNPRFQFVAETLRRVRDRFEQLRLTRTDVAFVVAERLLRKTPEQRAWIHRHLEGFAPLYPHLSQRLDDYVRLFPVHPRYLDIFEQLTIVEQRQALKTITRAIGARLDQPVPDTEPALVAYDDYWEVILADPTLRAEPAIREVVDKSQVLEERVRTAFVNKNSNLHRMALRLIRGLSVLRLTTGDIYAPLGATAAELRDGLCLYTPLPEPDADFLLTTVETALRDIVRTVSGQFISLNRDNGQYYLDLKKDIDYDALIAEKVRTLSLDQLDRYYFEALKRVLEVTDSTYVPGVRIWSYEVSWPGHRVTRPGYLFFGAPNDRPTAQPPRDFYLYFLQPYEPPVFRDDQCADEVFFRLTERDETFEGALRMYAAARELAVISSGETQRTYNDKADKALAEVQRWLRLNMAQAVMVTYEGKTRRLVEWAREAPRRGADLAIRDLVNAIASACLTSAFEDRYPEYPSFRGLREDVTERTRAPSAQEALNWLARRRTQPGAHVLDGLELLENGQLRPQRSRYARHILDLPNRQTRRAACVSSTERHYSRHRRASSASHASSWNPSG